MQTDPPVTVKDMARQSARLVLRHMSEAEVALSLIEFDLSVPEGSGYYHYMNVLQAMVHSRIPMVLQLGYLWLDERGYGLLAASEVQEELDQIRQEYLNRPHGLPPDTSSL